jgi:L-seryl-tRNA(Ser) seleniumtransferase
MSPGIFSAKAVESAPGGGALAGQTLPSWAVAVASPDPEESARRLRLGTPAVVSRIQEGSLLIDLRTVFVEDEEALIVRLLDCLPQASEAFDNR